MLELKVTNQNIILEQATPYGDPLVANSKGEYECKFTFDETWDGFSKIAIFTNIKEDIDSKDKEISLPQNLKNDVCTIPKEILRPDSYLKIGVWGTKGEIERPTVYTSSLYVRIGAYPNDNVPDSKPSIYIQIMQMISKTNEAVQSLRDDVESGKFGVPLGGTPGQIIVKKSDTDFDTEWQDPQKQISSWDEIESKPFETINQNEFEASDPIKELKIKEIAIEKISGLQGLLDSVQAGMEWNSDFTPSNL